MDKKIVNIFGSSNVATKTKKEKQDLKDAEKLTEKAKKETKKSRKTRFFSTVQYPESMPKNWIEILRESGLEVAISPLHNFDVQRSRYTLVNPRNKDEKALIPGAGDWWTQFKYHSNDLNMIRLCKPIKRFVEWLEKTVEKRKKLKELEEEDFFATSFLSTLTDEELEDIRAVGFFQTYDTGDKEGETFKIPSRKNLRIYKKPHYHVIYVLAKAVKVQSLVHRLQKLLGDEAVSYATVEAITSTVENVYKYFTHESLSAKRLYKHIYDKKDIVLLNGFNIENFEIFTPEQKKECLNVVSKMTMIFSDTYYRTRISLSTLHDMNKIISQPDTLRVYLNDIVIPMLNDEMIKLSIEIADKKDHVKTLEDKSRVMKLIFKLNQYKSHIKNCEMIVTKIENLDFPSYNLFLMSYISYRSIYRDYMTEAKDRESNYEK